MADAKLTALTAASALAAADLFYVSQSAASRKATGTQLLALVGTAYVPLAGGTMTGALTIASGTLTASAPALNITQTWNQGATAFTGALINITNTASSGASRAIDVQVAGTSIFAVRPDGYAIASAGVFIGSGGTNGLWDSVGPHVKSTGAYSWAQSANATDTSDLFLYRDAAATLAQRNGTNQQIFRLYNTYTDSSNYERLTLTGVVGTSVNITAETLGTGGDNIDIVLTPAGTGSVKFPSGASVDSSGVVTGAAFVTASAGYFGGVVIGHPSSDAAFLRGSAGQIDVTNGTANTYRDLKLRNLLAGGGNGSYVQTPSMTVANLAAAATAGAGARAFVTDANATTFLSTVAAGGANKVPVVSDGTNWLIG